MPTVLGLRDTVDDLLKVEEKAELIGGKIVRILPTGFAPNQVGGEIYSELRLYARATGRGFAATDGLGFTIPELPSGRESFCPDVAYHDGEKPAKRMRFVQGAPTFAVEVRSENDYGPAAERAMAAKRADYFAAGTKVVWDVDAEGEVIRSYRGSESDVVEFRRDGVADAEPAVPGWQVAVNAIFG